MPSTHPIPAVIGSGLSGLLISHALSKAGIDHVLIGGPPSTGSPRLGESLGIPATVHLATEFPDLAQFYGPKLYARVLLGEVKGGFRLDTWRTTATDLSLRYWNKRGPDYLFHLDRTEFDAVLYTRVTASRHCLPLEDRVAAIDVVPGTDRIGALDLENSGELAVSHVFDATGHVRLLARRLAIPRRMLGVTQNVVFAHYFKAENAGAQGGDAARPPRIVSDLDWRDGTTILRLYHEIDGFDGMAWCIPLGDKVSVGVSTPANGPALSEDVLLQRTQTRFARHHIHYGDDYPVRSRLGKAKMEFYTHARACGSNWLLAAAAHHQIWWTASTGLDLAVTAAGAAVPFIRKPAQTACRYQAGMNRVEHVQRLWAFGAEHRYGTATDHGMQEFENELTWLIAARFAHTIHLEREDWISAIGTRVASTMLSSDLSHYAPATGRSIRIETK